MTNIKTYTVSVEETPFAWAKDMNVFNRRDLGNNPGRIRQVRYTEYMDGSKNFVLIVRFKDGSEQHYDPKELKFDKDVPDIERVLYSE